MIAGNRTSSRTPSATDHGHINREFLPGHSRLMAPTPPRRRPIGFRVEERGPLYRKPRRVRIRGVRGVVRS
jgi:hypothetical protein